VRLGSLADRKFTTLCAVGNAGYRPELDGVRGLAILLVVVSHLFAGQVAAAGFAGVGIFFVLSGYLITGVLLRDGNLPRFYLHRVARLAPPLVITLAAVVASGYTAGVVPTVLYFANWPMAFVTNLGPLAHSWSLSIEEQFYLVFPLALPFLSRRVHVVLTIAAASVLIRFALPEAPMYYATVARLDGLLLGCALALTRWRANLTWPALALLGGVSLTGENPFAWSLTAITLAGAMLVASTPRVLLPLAPLGRISYSLYLYHWPLMWFLGPIGLALSFPLAWLSTRFFEEPVRRAARKWKPDTAALPVGPPQALALEAAGRVSDDP
jgi:peptidoglycan/LPS O-acetylase OafA/YrhL